MNPLMKIFINTHIGLYRMTGGRFGGSMRGGKVLLLTTTGNKTGARRTVPVMYYDDEDGKRYVIASAAGAPTHPAWFKNLSANPNVSVEANGSNYDARAEPLKGEERAKLWSKIIARFQGFDEYAKKAGSREIPVVELVKKN